MAIREKKNKGSIYPFLWRTYPLLSWKECANCELEFRNEPGWRFITGPWFGMMGVEKYLCPICGGNTLEEATLRIRIMESKNPTPPPRPVLVPTETK